MSDQLPIDDEWEDSGTSSILESYKTEIIGLLAALGIGAGIFISSTGASPQDLHVAYLKGNHSEVLKLAEELLLSETDDYVIAEIESLRGKTYADKTSDVYDPLEALSYLETSFGYNKSKMVAVDILILMDTLKVDSSRQVLYLEYLSDNGEQTATEKLVEIYIASSRARDQGKAVAHLKKLPQTTANVLSLAKIHLNRDSGAYSASEGIRLLEGAAQDGSGEALYLLSEDMINRAKVNKKHANKILADYQSVVTRAVYLSYHDAPVMNAINTLRFGRHGVQRNVALAKELEAHIKKSGEEKQ